MMKNFDHDFTLPPFPAFPCVSRYIAIGPVADAVQRVTRSIQAREAISLVIGPPGTGKSLVCSLVAKEFLDSHDVVVLGETTLIDENAFFRALLHRLGVAIETNAPNDLRLMIEQRLTGDDASPGGLVLIVDEAATLSEEVLECIRRMTNMMKDDQPAVSAVLAGGVKLDEALASPRMESLVQRVAARCYLHPLNAQESRDYIRECIESCGASPEETVTEAAISSVHHATAGVTRLINQMMTEAIDCAADLDETLIDEHTVNQAWAQLQQLPSPMTEEPKLEGHVSDVEFGELSELNPIGDDNEPSVPENSAVPETGAVPEASGSYSISGTQESDDSMTETLEFEPMSEVDFSQIDSSAAASHASCESVQPETPRDSVSLFGMFDDEEEIEVGSAATPDAPAGRPSESLTLESMLHSEIISLSHFAAENTESRVDPAIETEMNEEIDPAPAAVSPTSGNDAPSVVWYDEPEYSENADVHRDDSDLLWITEDIDVERREVTETPSVINTRVDQASSPDSLRLNVDYRELLEKMRSQS